ncbi:hypothetical protein ACFRAR_10920 [Kitasatospora sp. NPDC056651]|uniref:hypothetical protein n=1 Tax=Kitasatospora sp. NPDC056651 TaxID=3345892 RepID=UPI0036B44F2D
MISPDQTGELVEATYTWARSLETAFGAPEPRRPGALDGAAQQMTEAVVRARQRVLLAEPADSAPGRRCWLGLLTGALADSARRGRDVRLLLGGKRPWRPQGAAEWAALDGLQQAGVVLRAVSGPVQPMLLTDAAVLLGAAREASAGPDDVLEVTERSTSQIVHHLAAMLWESGEPL